MIGIVAWAGAFFALIGGVGMLVAPHKAAGIRNPRLIGTVLLCMAAFNVFLATRVL